MPFELLFGFKPNIPSSLSSEPKPIYNYDDYCAELLYRLQVSWKIAKENLISQKEKSKSHYDSKSNFQVIKEGDEVLLESPSSPSKTKSLRTGPFLVEKCLSDLNSIIKIGNKSVTFHNDRLTIYHR